MTAFIEPSVAPAEAVAPVRRDPGAALAVEIGVALHRYGTPSHLLEDALAQVARACGLEAHWFVTPTSIHASFGPPGGQTAVMVRLEPGSEDLGKLAQLQELLDDLGPEPAALEQARRRLAAILASPSPWPSVLEPIAFALASATAARFFGGGWRELAVAGAIGLLTGILALLGGRSERARRLLVPGAAFAASLISVGVAHLLPPMSAPIAMLAGLILLVPGLGLTVAMTELTTGHLASGTARLSAVVVTFLAMGFGVALGHRVGVGAWGAPELAEPLQLPLWTEGLALFLAPLGFTVLFRALPRDCIWILLAGVLAFAGARLGAHTLGPELGVCVGATVVGVVSNLYARWRQRPASVPLVPGILMLVPGSFGFRSLAALLDQDVITGTQLAFTMTLVAMALVTGLLFANLVVRPRGAL